MEFVSIVSFWKNRNSISENLDVFFGLMAFLKG
jgi:hypothetical protein